MEQLSHVKICNPMEKESYVLNVGGKMQITKDEFNNNVEELLKKYRKAIQLKQWDEAKIYLTKLREWGVRI
jgi:hypothetical protein